MTRLIGVIVVAVALVGCASKQKAKTDAPPPERKMTAAVVPQNPTPRALAFNGRVASVNEKLRFVVVDFTSSRRPELDQRLSVYRVGQKVGEIKVSGPYRNTTVAADLTAGEAKFGDEVKGE